MLGSFCCVSFRWFYIAELLRLGIETMTLLLICIIITLLQLYDEMFNSEISLEPVYEQCVIFRKITPAALSEQAISRLLMVNIAKRPCSKVNSQSRWQNTGYTIFLDKMYGCFLYHLSKRVCFRLKLYLCWSLYLMLAISCMFITEVNH